MVTVRDTEMRQTTESLAGVTALMYYRHDSKWDMGQTLELDPIIASELTALYYEERDGSLSTIDDGALKSSSDIEDTGAKKS